MEELDRHVALQLGVTRHIDHASGAAAELADQSIAGAFGTGETLRARDGLAHGRRGGSAARSADLLGASSDIGVVDIAGEHSFVAAQRAQLVACAPVVFGEQVVRAGGVLFDLAECFEMRQGAAQLTAPVEHFDQAEAKIDGGLRRGRRRLDELLQPFGRQALVTARPERIDAFPERGGADFLEPAPYSDRCGQRAQPVLLFQTQVERLGAIAGFLCGREQIQIVGLSAQPGQGTAYDAPPPNAHATSISTPATTSWSP